MNTSPRFQLADDGTLDTVILDTHTDQEHRFNFQALDLDDDDDYTYDRFIKDCIEELEAELT